MCSNRCRQRVALAILCSVGAAHAAPIQLLIDPAFGSTENTGATARITLDFSESGLDDLLTLTLENTTPPAIGSSLTAIGLELPDLVASSPVFASGGTDAYFDTLTFDVSVSPPSLDAPNGYDLVLSSDGNFLGGSPLGAPIEGETRTVVLNLGDTGHTLADLADSFAVFYNAQPDPHLIARFQAVGLDGEDSDRVLGRVPEPATLLMLAVGGLAMPITRFTRRHAHR